MSRQADGLTALDGFAVVDVALSEIVTGPFRIERFELTRHGRRPYLMRASAITTGAALLDFSGSQIGVPGAPLLGALARQAPLGNRDFPVSVSVQLASEGGRLRISSGGGTIAGYPAGPIATAIAVAVARRLELT